MNQWPEIINSLLSHAEKENIIFKIASITALLYISQEFEGKKCFGATEIDKILSLLIKNINFELNIKLSETAFNCLNSYIPFAIKNFSINEERKIIFTLIYSQLKNNTESMRLLAMKCLVEIEKNFYEYLVEEIRNIYDFTFIHVEEF